MLYKSGMHDEAECPDFVSSHSAISPLCNLWHGNLSGSEFFSQKED